MCSDTEMVHLYKNTVLHRVSSCQCIGERPVWTMMKKGSEWHLWKYGVFEAIIREYEIKALSCQHFLPIWGHLLHLPSLGHKEA